LRRWKPLFRPIILKLIRSGTAMAGRALHRARSRYCRRSYTPEGTMLVVDAYRQCSDGADASNKSGPNLVCIWRTGGRDIRRRVCRVGLDGSNWPQRLLLPFRKKLCFPPRTSAVNVLAKSRAHQRYDALPTAPLAMVMRAAAQLGVDVEEFDATQTFFGRLNLCGPGGTLLRWERRVNPAITPSSPPASRQAATTPCGPLPSNARSTELPAL